MPYIGKAPSSGIRSRFIYTATSSQTTFTGADGNGKTLGYTDGEYVDVYKNGVLLNPADYTATSKTSVVLDSGASASDIVEIVVYDTFSVFNGTFTGDLTVDSDTLFVDASENKVGIGMTSSLEKFTVANTSSGIVGRFTNNINQTLDLGITSGSGSAGGAYLNNANSGYIAFQSGGSERLRMLAGGGLTFNGDTATANALDDYEEGSWTPSDGGSNIDSIGSQSAFYTKIGNKVTVSFYANIDPTNNTQTIAIGGLPYAVTDKIVGTQVEAVGVVFEDDSLFFMWANGGTSLLQIEFDRPVQGSASTAAKNYRGTITYFSD